MPRLIPGGGAGVAAAAVSRGGSSWRSPVGSVELCVTVRCRAPGWFEHWERSDVSATTWLKAQKENEWVINAPFLVNLLLSE